uniref:Uncharacterized protein n=1 Tax=Arundo donax TaxID=35708 RepID=A0A0A8XSZ8_ARUDO
MPASRSPALPQTPSWRSTHCPGPSTRPPSPCPCGIARAPGR